MPMAAQASPSGEEFGDPATEFSNSREDQTTMTTMKCPMSQAERFYLVDTAAKSP